MDIFFSGQNLEDLAPLLSDDFSFVGPLFQFNNPQSYIEALKADPPKQSEYRIIHSFENSSSACLVYIFAKPGIRIPMAQLFKIQNNQINEILLIFDGRAFTWLNFSDSLWWH